MPNMILKPPVFTSGGLCHIKFNVFFQKRALASLDENKKRVYAVDIVEV